MFQLPKLPYAYDALEPYIDAQTMELHYEKHHQTYINNLNDALAPYPELQHKTIEELVASLESIPEKIRKTVQDNGGGHYNHSLFWEWMAPQGGKPLGASKDELLKKFGSFDAFQEQFNHAAKSRFGSGWAWLVLNSQGTLEIVSSANQDTPRSQGSIPLLGLDVWEHAYYLKYQNKRVDYIAAWWQVANWEKVEQLFREQVGKRV